MIRIRSLSRMQARARGFHRDERGSFTVEAVLILPMLVWACLAILTYVDAYRAQITNARITFAIGDMLSRWQENTGVDQEYIDGLLNVFDYLADGRENTYLRVTSLIWDESNDEHVLLWSQTSQSAPTTYSPGAVTEATLDTITPILPVLADGDAAIVVETWLDYTPPFNMGISARRFDNETVVSPRFIPQLVWD